MIDGIRQVDALPDPIGEITDLKYRPSGIQVGKMRVPLGVVGIIYESRPNVTADAAALCLKAGNACILRGGSEAIASNTAIAAAIARGLVDAQLPPTVVQLVATTDRAAVGAMLKLREYIDVLVPRGGKGLIERVTAESSIPIIKHLDGVCHVYIDDGADPTMAVAIAVNSKTEKYAVCNALETLLVAQSIAPRVLPTLRARFDEAGVELRGCAKTRALLPGIGIASEADWSTEYLAPVLSIRIVSGLDEAIAHITTYGSQHTDVIVSNDYTRARRFLARSGFRIGDGQRVDPVCRWFRVWSWRRDRHLHRQTARARAGRTRGSDEPEIRGVRQRRDPASLIGFLGGTFDPIHNGHLHAGRTAAALLNLERVHLVLAARPAHRAQPSTTIAQRWAMLELAVAGDTVLVADDREVRRDASSYTVETLEELRAERGVHAPLVWLLGWDAYRSLPTWRRWQELLELAHLAVLRRPGSETGTRCDDACVHRGAPRR